MKRLILLALLLTTTLSLQAQSREGDFKFGILTPEEVKMTVYPKDSSAPAVVLNEFGKARINLNNDYYYRLFFYYHKRIKILKKEGFEYATFSIPLWKGKNHNGLPIKDIIITLKASTFNFNGTVTEIKFDEKSVFTEDTQSHDLLKFTLPNIKEGSIVEISYEIESPFYDNFHNWEFQEEIPKIYSEYWAQIPGTHNYNISLKGFLGLSKEESKVIDNCISFGSSKATCAEMKFAMKDIPAFYQEDFMTSPRNFIASLNFELKEYTNIITGSKDAITKEWKDADLELKLIDDFGGQIKKGRYNFWDEKLGTQLSAQTNTLSKAKTVYEFVKSWYTWNKYRGIFCQHGIKKAYDKRSGDIADINLSLISALRYAGIDVSPVILSTRDNGLTTDVFPVLSEFNYVIAYCEIDGKKYFLDASDKNLPFGMLPERCLNGKGRIFNENFQSEWIEIPNQDKTKSITMMNLRLEEDGTFKGTIDNFHYGYFGYQKRKEITGFNTIEEYIASLNEKSSFFRINNHTINNLDNSDTTLVEKFEVEIKQDLQNMEDMILDPYFGDKWETNPFKSKERLFPVDFGRPFEYQTILQLQYPESYQLVNLPEKVALALPSNGGRFLMSIQNIGNKIMLNNSLSINKPIYSSGEYFYLKELFAKVVATHSVDLIFKKRE